MVLVLEMTIHKDRSYERTFRLPSESRPGRSSLFGDQPIMTVFRMEYVARLVCWHRAPAGGKTWCLDVDRT